MILAAFILLTGFFVFYLLSAFFEKDFRGKKLEVESPERQNLRVKKEMILEAMRDLEYDYKMKKVNEQDYLQLKENLTREAIEIMKSLDAVEGIVKENAVSFAASKSKPRKKVRT